MKMDYLEKRKLSIGASEAAAVLGLSKYRTPLEVYMEKTEQLPAKEPNFNMALGNLLEPIIAQLFEIETTLPVVKNDVVYFHKDYSFISATPDYFVKSIYFYTKDSLSLVECKSTGFRNKDRFENGEVPM